MTGHVLGDEANSTHYCAMLRVKNTDGQVWADDSVLHLKDVSLRLSSILSTETSLQWLRQAPGERRGSVYRKSI